MLLALGALSTAVDALQSLSAKKSSSSQATAGFSQSATTPFDGGAAVGPASDSGGSAPGGGISPATMSALFAAQDQSSSTVSTSRSDALKDLFSQLDADGDGQISKSEFENALGAGGSNLAQADDVFGKLDKNGDGSVSLDEMSSALKGAGAHGHRHKHHVGGSEETNSDPLLQALDGASSTSTTNSDGSTTTALTYADGSRVTMTSARTASASAAASYNFIEQMIQREAQAISAAVASPLSVTA
jgi:Ca2+-binding EF-hand superfamily protein